MFIRTAGRGIVALIIFMLASIASANPVWIDVRSATEHAEDNIEGDILIPHESIAQEIQRLYPDKSTDIRLYCRSGRRAGLAKSELNAMGYSQVSNAGGINDAREQRDIPVE